MMSCRVTAPCLVLVAVLVTVCARPAGEKYTNQYDHMDVDKILGNDRLYGRYKDCLMEKGVCPPPAKLLKDNLKEVLHTNCAKCTDEQRKMLKKTFNYVHEKHPGDLQLVVKHYGTEHDNVDDFIHRLETDWE